MRFLANENIPIEAVESLRRAGLDIVSVAETMPRTGDVDVLEVANREQRVVITFDKDFAELVFREHRNALAGVILLRIRPSSARVVADILTFLLKSDRPWWGHFSVVTEARIRMVPL